MKNSKKPLGKVGKGIKTSEKTSPKKVGKKFVTEAVTAAAMIRRELKKFFPKIKFTVTPKSYAGGDNIGIYYVDGPTPRAVDDVVDKYRLGEFDSMDDSYAYTNRRDDVAQVHYIFVTRAYSDFNIEGTKQAIKKRFKLSNFSEELIKEKFNILPDQLLQQVLNALDFPPREESMKEIEKVKAEAKKTK